MLCLSMIFFFIYMRQALFQFLAWPIVLTWLASFFLLMGAGKQVVYQHHYYQGKYKHKEVTEKMSKSTFWQYGVFLYSMALPITMTANFIYFFDYGMF